MFSPVKYQQEAYQHTAEVGEMGHTVDDEQTHNQFDGYHRDEKPAVLYPHEPLASSASYEEYHKEQDDGIAV